jgi:hypothetical protein
MAKKRLKKFLKKAAPLLALGLGAAALGRRRQNKTYLAEEGGDRSDMRDYGPFSKAANIITRKKPRRDSILADPRINRMDTSEVDTTITPGVNNYRNMDMGLEGYYKNGGTVVKTGEKTTKLKKKTGIQIKGFGKARR